MYWSVRRELWENRSIYIAPISVAAVVLLGSLISTITLPRRMRAALALGPAEQHRAITMPFNVIAGLVIVTVFLVGVF
jgi:ABC-2 type transport system permease protein